MFGTLMLDQSGDLIDAVETGGFNTVGIALGSIEAAQNISLRVSTKRKDCWFNRAAGIDYNALFYDTNRGDTVMNPMRAQAFREALEGSPGFAAYADTDEVSFARVDRRLAVTLPCVVLSCDASRITPAVIG